MENFLKIKKSKILIFSLLFFNQLLFNGYALNNKKIDLGKFEKNKFERKVYKSSNIFLAEENKDEINTIEEDINKENLISALISGGHKDARDFENLEKLETFVKDNLGEGDLIIFLGAGDITQYARKFSDLLKGVEKSNA